jgi:hypothetical protein
MSKRIAVLAFAAALLPVAAQGTIYQFNADLRPQNEVAPPVPIVSSATGVATLFYDDKNTVSLADDTYNFAMSVFNLQGALRAYHIHGQATPLENAPVRVSLDAAPFVNTTGGTTPGTFFLLVGGNNVAPPAGNIPAGINPITQPAQPFFDVLRAGLAYVNVHTQGPPAVPGGTGFSSGEVRGQLIEVAAIPEPETYALMLAGLGFVGWAAARRRKVGV